MNPNTIKTARPPGKPICVGLTCWRWQQRGSTILDLARRFGVTLQLTQHSRGLRREIECQVSGANVDRFLGEFVRRF